MKALSASAAKLQEMRNVAGKNNIRHWGGWSDKTKTKGRRVKIAVELYPSQRKNAEKVFAKIGATLVERSGFHGMMFYVTCHLED